MPVYSMLRHSAPGTVYYINVSQAPAAADDLAIIDDLCHAHEGSGFADLAEVFVTEGGRLHVPVRLHAAVAREAISACIRATS
jgi:hypothetical protein